MSIAIEAELTLEQMRKAAGLTLAQAGVELGVAMGKKPYTYARISQIENEGTSDINQMEALASIYGVKFEDVRAAVKKVVK